MSKIRTVDYGFAEYPIWICNNCNNELCYALLPTRGLPSISEFTKNNTVTNCPYCGISLLKENKSE